MEAGTEHPRTGRLTSASTTRRLVGIDLGTTNSALAWVDAMQPSRGAGPHLLGISQLVAEGEVGTWTELPSFVYLPTPQEQEAQAGPIRTEQARRRRGRTARISIGSVAH